MSFDEEEANGPVNAEKVAVSGKKRTKSCTGGIRNVLVLGRALFNHLKVYKGPDHPHEAQKPLDMPIRDKRIQLQK